MRTATESSLPRGYMIFRADGAASMLALIGDRGVARRLVAIAD
jgi:hypothetical protein